MVRVGLVGCGTIGTQLALAVEKTYHTAARVTALHDVDLKQAQTLRRRLASYPSIDSLPQLIRHSDVILEAASVDVAGYIVDRALRAHRQILSMSVGGLLLDTRWKRTLTKSRGRVYLPSGALVGVDGIKAFALGRIRRLSLITRKPPQALASAPYVLQKKLRLTSLKHPRTIFQGSPAQAINAFPQNTNIAATLTLAAAQTSVTPRVRVVADPTIRVNRHELVVEADCGRMSCQIESVPSANPKTSELAIRSAIATLGRLFDALQIGT